MPQPPAYTIATDFSADESNAVAGRSTVRTTNLDTELVNIKAFIDQMRTNIALRKLMMVLQKTNGLICPP